MDAAEVDATATDADAATAADANAAISISAAEAWPTFEMFISLGGIGELLSFTSGDSSWTTVASADAAGVVVGVVCSGLLGSFPPSTIEVLLFCGVTSVCGPSNWTPCFRGLISSAAAAADTVTGVVEVVVAGTVFYTGVTPTVDRRLDFRDGVHGSDAFSPTHCSVGVAVVEIVVAVVVGTVSLWTTCGSAGCSAS